MKNKELKARMKEHHKNLTTMEENALKRYGGLGGVKYIEKVEISGDMFRALIGGFDYDNIIASMACGMKVKPTQKKNKWQNTGK